MDNQFANYSPDELESQLRVIWVGYLIITIASLLAMTFFVTHNMIGTSKPIWGATGLNWGISQLAYLVISVGFSFGFNAFTWQFYQMKHTVKSRTLVLLVAVSFPMFAEVGQSMTRAEDTRHEAATSSETFKTMQGRVANAGVSVDMGVTTALSGAMAEKAKAESELAACIRYTSDKNRARCERIEMGNIAAAQAKIAGYQQAGKDSITASSSQLQQDAQTLKALEGDNDYLQPIVKLLMSFGIPAIGASFLIALTIIGAMEVAMAYLGGLLHALKSEMRARGIAVSSRKIKARYVDESHRIADLSAQAVSNVVQASAPKMSVEDTVKRIHADVKASGATSAAEIKAAVVDSYTNMTNPAPLNDVILERVANKLAAKSALTTPPPLQETVLPTVPARSETVLDTVPARLQNGLTDEGRQVEADLYPEWISRVSAKTITAGARDCKRFISQSTFHKGDKTGLTIQEMGRIWLIWQGRAEIDGVLTANPDYANGKAKYLLAA